VPSSSLAERAERDSELAAVLRKKQNIILGYYFYQRQYELEDSEISDARIERSFQAIYPTAFPEISGLEEALPEMKGVVANADVFSAAVKGQGYFNAFPDIDGVIRRFPLMVSYRDKIFPSIALETFAQHTQGFKPVPVREEDGTLRGVSVGPRYIPTNHRGEMLINYRGGRKAFPIYSASDVLQGKIDASKLKGKSVLIGATAIGIYDLRVTPMSSNTPGILVQANLLDNLYQGDFLIENAWTRVTSLALMIILTILLALLLPRLRILVGLVVTIAILGGYYALTQWAFNNGYVLALVAPLLELTTLFVTFTIYRGLTEEREKKIIREAFQAYLHPDLVREMTKDVNSLKLGGEAVDCTILFSDVRNFTGISEQMSPQRVVELMNSYFDPIAKAIIAEGGYIDKFIGDAVMAIFGAPKPNEDHPLQACRAAVKMQAIAIKLEREFQDKYGIAAFRTGIGLHSGIAVVGNIGTRERLNYT